MALDLIPLLPAQNVVATGTAVIDLSNLLGTAIEGIYLQLGGGAFTKAMVTSVQLKANGKVIYDSTGSRIDARMQYRGLTANASFLPIDFTEVRALSKVGKLSGVLDTTLGVKNLRLEVTITGATTPTLTGYAAVSAPFEGPQYADMQSVRPLIARVHSATISIGAAGTFDLTVPHMDPLAGGSIFKRIMVFSSNMTGLEVIRNGITEHKSVKALNDWRNSYEGFRTAQAGLYPFDPIVDNFQEGRVFDTRPAMGTTNARFSATFSGAETVTVEVETLEPLDAY